MGCFDVIEKELRELGFIVKELIILMWKIYMQLLEFRKIILFLGHTDVVPTGPEEKWKYPPFSATIEGDILYGRGAADMKASVAAFIESAKEFISSSSKINFRLGFLLTSNEEGTAKDGFIDQIIKKMINDNEIIDFCLVGETKF